MCTVSEAPGLNMCNGLGGSEHGIRSEGTGSEHVHSIGGMQILAGLNMCNGRPYRV